MTGYITLKKAGAADLVVTKSRFLGFSYPVPDEDAALSLLQDIRRRHPQASHVCYAYVLGANMGVQRYSDDGEPQGTAGLPILDALRKPLVVNALAVVVRYFGGTLLGAGGLVRAYSAAACAAVRDGTPVRMLPTRTYQVTCPYPLHGKLARALAASPAVVADTQFGQEVALTVRVREEDAEVLAALIANATDARARAELAARGVDAWDEPGAEA